MRHLPPAPQVTPPEVLSFFSSRWNGAPPTTHPHASVLRGEGHTRWRERGWESSNSDEATYTVVLYICMYFVGDMLLSSWHTQQKVRDVQLVRVKQQDDPVSSLRKPSGTVFP